MIARSRLRIGLVAPTLRLMGGHAVQAARLLDGWRGDSEIDVRLVPIDPIPARALTPATRIKYARTVATQLSYWPLLLRELRRVDIVHVFCTSNSSFFLTAMPAILTARMCGKPVVVNYRGDGREHLSQTALARRVVGLADVNVVPSEYFRAIFADLAMPARIVPNVADLARFGYRVRKPIRPRLLSTRNFESIYNVSCTLRAFARVQARFVDASLVLVGAGREAGALRVLARDLGLRNVTFTGTVPHERIHRCYEAADIFVQTPRIDNMPGSVIEAFASGLPVVSTAVGGVPLILQHNVHGFLAPDDDDGSVARLVVELLEHQERAREMAAHARASCAAYEWPLVREQWRSVYREVASGQRLQEVA